MRQMRICLNELGEPIWRDAKEALIFSTHQVISITSGHRLVGDRYFFQ